MNLFAEVEHAINTIGDGWTTVSKGQTIAAMIVALRPSLSVEIGVYCGKGLLAMALAHKANQWGKAVGIDPYDARASLEGQIKAEDRKFWGDLDYEWAFNKAQNAIAGYGCQDFAEIMRQRSNLVPVPAQGSIGVLRVDGNHGDTAVNDAMKFCPAVQRGGFIFIDDIEWAGKAPTRAAQWLEAQPHYYRRLYGMDDGLVFQRL